MSGEATADEVRAAALDAIDECAAFHWGLLIAAPEHVQEASRERFREARQPFLDPSPPAKETKP